MFNTILAAVDVNDEPLAKRVLSAAKSMAAGSDANIHALGVVPDYEMEIVAQYFPSDFKDKAAKTATETLEGFCNDVGVSAEVHVTVGRVYDEIISNSKNLGADLIVVGAHAEGISDYLVGSNARKVVAHAGQSVLVIRD